MSPEPAPSPSLHDRVTWALALFTGAFEGLQVPSWVITLCGIALTLAFVVLFVALGWSIVWYCFLSRFKFVRELLGNASPSPPDDASRTTTPEKKPRVKRPKRE